MSTTMAGQDHAFVRGLLLELPPLEGDYWHVHGVWTEEGLHAWLEAAEKGLRAVYDVQVGAVR